MKDSAGALVLGRTRWRRFALLFTPAVFLVGVLMFMLMTGALAVSFAMSGIPFKLSASTLQGQGFVQYAQPDQVTNFASGLLLPKPPNPPGGNATGQAAGHTYVADTVQEIGSADISNLHQTVCGPLPGPLAALGNLVVTIDAGNAGTPAHANTLVVNAPSLAATSATFNNIQIGEDRGVALGGAPDGNFAQTATSVTIQGLNQVAIGTSAGTFTLPNLHLGAGFIGTCP